MPQHDEEMRVETTDFGRDSKKPTIQMTGGSNYWEGKPEYPSVFSFAAGLPLEGLELLFFQVPLPFLPVAMVSHAKLCSLGCRKSATQRHIP